MKKWTSKKIAASKGAGKIACVTAYDTITARIADAAGIPLILVGDSLATTSLGYPTTIPATMDMMIHHTAAVSRGAADSLVVGDMPFLSYQVNDEQAILNAGRFLREGNADAVKLEGGEIRAGLISKLVSNGIPVMAHIGVLPQSVYASGYKAKGRGEEEIEQLKRDAVAITEAGAFSVVLECVTSVVAAEITAALRIPTIGIGAGNSCDGQILVIADLLGMTPGPVPKFVKPFADFYNIGCEAVKSYKASVEAGEYPDAAHQYF